MNRETSVGVIMLSNALGSGALDTDGHALKISRYPLEITKFSSVPRIAGNTGFWEFTENRLGGQLVERRFIIETASGCDFIPL